MGDRQAKVDRGDKGMQERQKRQEGMLRSQGRHSGRQRDMAGDRQAEKADIEGRQADRQSEQADKQPARQKKGLEANREGRERRQVTKGRQSEEADREKEVVRQTENARSRLSKRHNRKRDRKERVS